MEIIVLSDTHMPKKAKQLPERFLKELKDVDVIIHAGDWQTLDLYETLKDYAPVYGVYGNVDGKEIQNKFPAKQMLEWEGYRIGLIHGHGEKKTTEKRALEAFVEDDVDVLIYGHSHIPVLRYFKKTLLFNPGSLTDKRRVPMYSFGKLSLTEKGIHAEHIFFVD
ncbi:YfcE family phosphodiesterase [Halobacillus litoralis]|uniref:Phosphoesterase n=1 Tax=Halobacillus litoralis TaxID=45668 RepID=A0A845E5Z9_9BACI|nr:metallophosphoesterase family protein [Halobacillus litoralis]MYL50690.1 YfcE family phosphodiesterase [Halobacillus litoralis]